MSKKKGFKILKFENSCSGQGEGIRKSEPTPEHLGKKCIRIWWQHVHHNLANQNLHHQNMHHQNVCHQNMCDQIVSHQNMQHQNVCDQIMLVQNAYDQIMMFQSKSECCRWSSDCEIRRLDQRHECWIRNMCIRLEDIAEFWFVQSNSFLNIRGSPQQKACLAKFEHLGFFLVNFHSMAWFMSWLEGFFSWWSRNFQDKCPTSKLEYEIPSFHWCQDCEFWTRELQISKEQRGDCRLNYHGSFSEKFQIASLSEYVILVMSHFSEEFAYE